MENSRILNLFNNPENSKKRAGRGFYKSTERNHVLPIEEGRSLPDVRWWTLALFVCVCLLTIQHLRSALDFPPPWPDEAHFLWQAAAVSDANSLFAPELNAEREIFWMPPGYMILQGLVFKATGVSLIAARWTSFAFITLTFLALSFALRRTSLPWIALGVCLVFFLHGAIQACGNVGRMEAGLIFLFISCFLALSRHRLFTPLALLAASPLLHPNGAYFLMGALIYVGLSSHFGNVFARFRSFDAIVGACALILWLLFVWHVSAHWEHFVSDMSYQFFRKSNVRVWENILNARQLMFVAAIGAAFVIQWFKRTRYGWMLAVSASTWIIYRIGHELWYEVFDGLAYLFLVLFFVEALAQRLNTSTLLSGFRTPLALAVTLAALLYWSNRSGVVHSPTESWAGFTWNQIEFPAKTAYYREFDRDIIRIELSKISSPFTRSTVQFLPRADGLLYANMNDSSVIPYSPVFATRPADYYLIHRAQSLPAYWSNFEKRDLLAAGYDSLETKWLVYHRDSTEQWFLFPGNKTDD